MPETITAFVAATATAAGANAATAAAIASATVAVGKLAISYGINALLTPSSPTASQGRNVSSEGGVAPHAVLYGRNLVSGHVCAEHGWPKKGAKLKFYTRLYATAGHRCDALEGWLIDGKPYTPNADGFITDAPYRAKSTNFLQVFHSLGRRDEPVNSAYQQATRPRNSSSGAINPSASPWWRDTDRLQGRAWQAFIGEYDDAAFPGGQFPQIAAIWRGKPIYDPRKDTTQPGGSGSQRADNPDTWSWTDNWALVCADYWRSEYGPMRDSVVDLPGRVMPSSRVDWASVIAAANASDEQVTNGTGGTEARYRLWAYLPNNDNPRSNFDMLVLHGAGWYSEDGGKLSLWAGVYHPPAVDGPTIRDDWATGPVTVERLKSRLGRFNGVRGEWVDPDQTWRAVSYPEVVDAAALARDKNRKSFQPFNLSFSPSAGQAIRVASILIRRTLFPRTVRFQTDRLGLLLAPGHTVPVDLPSRRLTGSTFKVSEWSFTAGGRDPDTCELVLEEDHPDIYRLPAALDADAPPLSPPPPAPGADSFLDNRLYPPNPVEAPIGIAYAGGGFDLSWTPLEASEGDVQYEVWAKRGTPVAKLENVRLDAVRLGSVRDPVFRHVAVLDAKWTFYVRAVDAAGLTSSFLASPALEPA